MVALVVCGIILALLCVSCWAAWKRLEYCQMMSKIPGPPARPLVGNSLQLKRDSNEFRLQVRGWVRDHEAEGLIILWLGPKAVVLVFKPEYVEEILASQKNITKTPLYNFLHPWLGTGLLTSTGRKWKSRRRLLTQTFHFKILNDFVSIHQKQAGILVQLLREKAGKGVFDIVPHITLCVLDIICETSMGVNIKAQFGNNAEYIKTVFSMCKLIQERQKSPWLWPDIIYNRTTSGKQHQDALNILHGFTNKVINDRIEQRKGRQQTNGVAASATPMYSSTNRRIQAFMDLLLDEYDKGNITKEGVREEVDTFMFEGHDTTAASLQWAVHLLGLNPDVQSKLQNEVDAFFESIDGDIRPEQLKGLTFLECVLKEALRLLPSVPLLGRELTEGCKFGPYHVPKGCTVLVATLALHRNPEVWEEPDTFKPERFLPEHATGRHPFAYVPFSAGPRNCIGQRFAMMEEKIVLASIVRNFNITSTQITEEIKKSSELILNSTEGIIVKLEGRDHI